MSTTYLDPSDPVVQDIPLAIAGGIILIQITKGNQILVNGSLVTPSNSTNQIDCSAPPLSSSTALSLPAGCAC